MPAWALVALFAALGFTFVMIAFAAYRRLPNTDSWLDQQKGYSDVWLIVLSLLSIEAQGHQNLFRGFSAGTMSQCHNVTLI